MRLRFSSDLWEHPGEGSWHFVTVPLDVSDELRARPGPRRGFGSVKVTVTVGGSTWSTSVFPSKDGTYVLPVKRAVRVAEAIDDGDSVDVTLDVVD